MHLISRAVALSAVLFAFEGAASAGWYAKQTMAAKKKDQGGVTAELYYEDGRLRIDQTSATQGPGPTMIIEMKDGNMILLDHSTKAFHKMSIDDLVKAKDAMIGMLKQMRDKVPPEKKQELEEQLKQLESSEHADPKPTGKKDKVAGFACDFYSWKTSTSEGEVCLATKTGIDMSGFAKNAEKLGKTISSLASADQASMAFLTLANKGFPVKSKQRSKVRVPGSPAPVWMESESEVKELKKMKVPASKFEIPKGYEQKMPAMPGAMPPPPPPAK